MRYHVITLSSSAIDEKYLLFAAKIRQTVKRMSSVIFGRQLFVGHVVGLGPMKEKERKVPLNDKVSYF